MTRPGVIEGVTDGVCVPLLLRDADIEWELEIDQVTVGDGVALVVTVFEGLRDFDTLGDRERDRVSLFVSLEVRLAVAESLWPFDPTNHPAKMATQRAHRQYIIE